MEKVKMVVEPLTPLTPERRRQQTRDALLAAGAQIFAERGFHGASLDEVAAVAGFTKGAVYSNFKSKDDLFLAVLESRYRRNFAALEATVERTPDDVEDLSGWIDHIRSQFNEEEQLWGALTEEFTVYAIRHAVARDKLAAFLRADADAVAELIAAERAAHGIQMPESPLHQARIVTALFRGLAQIRAIDPDAIDDAQLQSVMSFIARAMTPGS